MTSRKHPSVAFWATVMVVAALVAYPLSWGPACWFLVNFQHPLWLRELILDFYRPLTCICTDGPTWAKDALEWYMDLWRDF